MLTAEKVSTGPSMFLTIKAGNDFYREAFESLSGRLGQYSSIAHISNAKRTRESRTSHTGTLKMNNWYLKARSLRAAEIYRFHGISQANLGRFVGASLTKASRLLAGNITRPSRLFEEISSTQNWCDDKNCPWKNRLPP